MTSQEMIAFKTNLKNTGLALINKRIELAKQMIANAQEAANNEEKSSAGDKYETGRAMGHLEKDMHTRRQEENKLELDRLQKISTEKIYTTAQPGSFIKCKGQSFFIAAGLGKQTINEETVFFLSPLSPLAKLLHGKKEGDTFLFNKEERIILTLY
ncbi:hypothetical protein SIO70_25580 [Chitinophaga sancti]|uniref:hypothetical protein n=1 Tax=Chitinophaga sancti TaxID=1004 RepID=UPI002A764DDF|nr:hypothetical protein [Chitinophaga sancti]WPQ61736.1 hypothetical protein SIO70_25580 [Chitinophaga sancti]